MHTTDTTPEVPTTRFPNLARIVLTDPRASRGFLTPVRATR